MREMDCVGSNGGEWNVEDDDVAGKGEWDRGGATMYYLYVYSFIFLLTEK